MLTKISQLFVIHQKTTSFSYIRQAYDPCLRHGDSLRSHHAFGTGSPACRGKPLDPLCRRFAPPILCSPKHWLHKILIITTGLLMMTSSCAHEHPMPIITPCLSCSHAHLIPIPLAAFQYQ